MISDLEMLWLVSLQEQSRGLIQYDFRKTVQEGRFERTRSLNGPPDVLLTALANLQSKHMMEGDELAKHLSAMLRILTRWKHGLVKPYPS
jgi:hypothetical protein